MELPNVRPQATQFSFIVFLFMLLVECGGTSVAAPPSTPLVIPDSAAMAARATYRAAREFQAQLDLVSGELKGAATVAANLTGFFTSDFMHTGLNTSDFITKVLSREVPVNRGGFTLKDAKLDSVHVKRVVDASNMEVSFRVTPSAPYRPWTETMWIKKVSGKWLMKGDGHLAMIGVYTLSRLKETPRSTAEMLALSDVTPIVLTPGGPTYYQRAVKDAAGNPILNSGVPVMEWLGSPDDPGDSWGKMGWVGGEATPAERLLREQYNHRYSKPSTAVSHYIRLEVSSTRVSALVDHVIVTGPGLPARGLTLVPSPAFPRPYWIYRNDPSHWEAFNTDRCRQIDQIVKGVHSVPHCRLDWNAIRSGSVYTFTLFSHKAILETLKSKLAAKPDISALLYKAGTPFARFNQPAAYQFEIKNIFNDVDGPFMPGKIFPLSWINPTRPGIKLAWVSFNTQDIDYLNGNAVVEDAQSYALYGIEIAGSMPTSQSFTVNALHPVKWSWATLTTMDIYGNRFDHELSPYNPY